MFKAFASAHRSGCEVRAPYQPTRVLDLSPLYIPWLRSRFEDSYITHHFVTQLNIRRWQSTTPTTIAWFVKASTIRVAFGNSLQTSSIGAIGLNSF